MIAMVVCCPAEPEDRQKRSRHADQDGEVYVEAENETRDADDADAGREKAAIVPEIAVKLKAP